MLWEYLNLFDAKNKGSDQPTHLRSLINLFTRHNKSTSSQAINCAQTYKMMVKRKTRQQTTCSYIEYREYWLS